MRTVQYIVHWPGKDVPACNEHKEQLVQVGQVMGFAVSYTAYPDEHVLTCTNCQNEARKAEGQK